MEKLKKTATVLQRLPGQPLKSKHTGKNHSTGRMWLLCSHTHSHTHTYEPSHTVINSVSNICWQTNMYTHTQVHTHAALLPLAEGKLSPQFSDSHKKNRILLHTRWHSAALSSQSFSRPLVCDLWPLRARPLCAGVFCSIWTCTRCPPTVRRSQCHMSHLILFCLIRGTMQDGGPAFVRKGCLRISLAVALWVGSRTNILSRKPLSRGETWERNHPESESARC